MFILLNVQKCKHIYVQGLHTSPRSMNADRSHPAYQTSHPKEKRNTYEYLNSTLFYPYVHSRSFLRYNAPVRPKHLLPDDKQLPALLRKLSGNKNLSGYPA